MNSVTSTCRGGISALSAFSTGRGASAGIDLPFSVYMERGESNGKTEALPTLEFLDEKLGKGMDYYVETDSWIPSAMGLKSSSAFTLALTLSYVKLNTIELSDSEILRLSAEASIRNQTSITGALDDLAASYYGGICLTDNSAGKILMKRKVNELPVLILHSERKIRTMNLKNTDFSALKEISDGMESMIRAGNIFESMCLNGFLYGSILGIDAEMVGKLYREGALYAGQSGKGPALFAVFKTTEEAELARGELKNNGYNCIVTTFSNRKAEIEYV